MSIVIGADLVPTKSNVELFEKGDIDTLIGSELKDIILNADYRIFNLEIPLTDESNPIKKCGPNLIAPTKCISAYKAMNIDLLTLANNHILDQGKKGLESSIETLKSAGISYVGVGDSIKDASKPKIICCNGKKIGIYACVEHEFTVATETDSGANPIDLLETPDHIVELKKQCDYVIVLYHGGKEQYRYPSPNLHKTCRKLVEKGADLVICQHSHCIGCKEEYLQGTIVYGQGNFLFDDEENEYWQTSLLIMLSSDFEVKYIPLKKTGNSVRLAKGAEAENVLEQFNIRSEEILDSDKVYQHYSELADQYKNHYLFSVMKIKRGLLYRIINKLTKGSLDKNIINKAFNSMYRYELENYVECEAHRELLLNILKKG
ncbi:CapA family protein [Catenibacterium sp.]|uniref:CapA family protein n=1 Tax=Catenibacterium sp. TaxID=2049022 RepID=UPI002E760588|nr:CapA family protein [Catenibacterium sp.]MEE0041328.1 CapA family protein [Catenibacterium sp.]